MTQPLVPVDAHLQRILATVQPLSSLDLTLADAHGCILDEDVTAAFPLPPFDNSAMDGYAVRAVDIAAASPTQPAVLPVIGDIAAGTTTAYSVQPGLCVRIMTGAPMPPGADAVVPLESTDGGVAQVAIREPAAVGQHVRPAGGDAAIGSQVLRREPTWAPLRSVCSPPSAATGCGFGRGRGSWCSRPAASWSTQARR